MEYQSWKNLTSGKWQEQNSLVQSLLTAPAQDT